MVGGHLTRFDQSFRTEAGDPLGEPARECAQRGRLHLQLRVERSCFVVASIGRDEPIEVGVDQTEMVLQCVGLGDDLLEGAQGFLVELDRIAAAYVVLVVQRGEPSDPGTDAFVRVGELARVQPWIEGRQVPARQGLLGDGHQAKIRQRRRRWPLKGGWWG